MLKNIEALALIVVGLAITYPILAEIKTTQDEADIFKSAINNPARTAADRERDETSKPGQVIQFFGVKPGMKVLDLFSGGGYYSEILSYVIGPTGHVISHTNKSYESFVGEEAIARFKNGRLDNVERVTSEIDSLGLEPASVDMILMVLTYHDIYYTADYWPKVDRDNFFRQVSESLRPGGILAIIDHSARSDTGIEAAQELHRIDEAFARQDIESAGFTFDGASEVLRNPDDARTLNAFDEKIRRKTDRFVYRFIKK